MSITQILMIQMISDSINHEKQTNTYNNLKNNKIVYPKNNKYFKTMSKHVHNNNRKMRNYHTIKQPGYDVQRFGHK